MSQIQLNYASLLFWNIFELIHWKILFLVNKVTISEGSTEILREFVFLNKFEKGKSGGKFGFVKTTVFDQTYKRGQILTKTVFFLKISDIQPNSASLLFWSILGGNSLKTSLFCQKSDFLRKEHWNTQKFFFLNKFEKGQILTKIWICLNNFFYQTSKRWQILIKNVFLLKVSHIQLNYAFLLFWSIFVEIHRELLFLVKKVTSQKEAQNYLESWFFSISLKWGKSRGKFRFVVNNPFCSKQKNRTNIIKNCFSPQN